MGSGEHGLPKNLDCFEARRSQNRKHIFDDRSQHVYFHFTAPTNNRHKENARCLLSRPHDFA